MEKFKSTKQMMEALLEGHKITSKTWEGYLYLSKSGILVYSCDELPKVLPSDFYNFYIQRNRYEFDCVVNLYEKPMQTGYMKDDHAITVYHNEKAADINVHDLNTLVKRCIPAKIVFEL